MNKISEAYYPSYTEKDLQMKLFQIIIETNKEINTQKHSKIYRRTVKKLFWGTRGDIVVENGNDYSSSNPEQISLHFTYYNYLWDRSESNYPLSPAMIKIVGQTVLFSIDIATGRGEGNLWIKNLLNSARKIGLVSHSDHVEGLS